LSHNFGNAIKNKLFIYFNCEVMSASSFATVSNVFTTNALVIISVDFP